MRSGRRVLVLRADLERLEDQELLDAYLDCRRPLDQLRRDEDLHTVMFHGAVRCEVLPLEVGVDRHLGAAVSSEGWNEVQRHDATALAGEGQCFIGQRDVHT